MSNIQRENVVDNVGFDMHHGLFVITYEMSDIS